MKHLFIWIWLLLLSATVQAQNSIDELVENFSTVGSSSYTSAIERDPQTHQVVKVVKTLETRGHIISDLINAFKKEREKVLIQGEGKYEGAEDQVMFLATEDEKASRVYMLKYDGKAYQRGKVTIIIRPK